MKSIPDLLFNFFLWHRFYIEANLNTTKNNEPVEAAYTLEIIQKKKDNRDFLYT